MLVAVTTIIAHNSIPHHHKILEPLEQHNHHEDEVLDENHGEHETNTQDHHSIFSFAQLDEGFVPAKFQYITFKLPVLYLLAPALACRVNEPEEISETHFSCYQEFPPPGNYSSDFFSRPPPAC